jgi:endonuclease YncB( thermonuclease family)
MRIGLLLVCLLMLTGCVTEVYDAEGRRVGRDALARELVVDDSGRIIGRPSRLVPPHTLIINGGTPTEREIRLLGVEGKSHAEAPVTFERARQWMNRYLRDLDEVYIRPAVDTNYRDYVIYGDVYISAKDAHGGAVRGYVSINEAMLYHGFVQLREIREFEPEVRERMQNAEDRARREREGLWSSNP